MSTTNKFCPNCSTLLQPIEKMKKYDDATDNIDADTEDVEGLYLVCGDCAYREKINTFSVSHFSKKIEIIPFANPNRIVNDYRYDMTFPRTKSKTCANSKCPSQGNQNPEIVQITEENRPEVSYLCTVCNNMW